MRAVRNTATGARPPRPRPTWREGLVGRFVDDPPSGALHALSRRSSFVSTIQLCGEQENDHPSRHARHRRQTQTLDDVTRYVVTWSAFVGQGAETLVRVAYGLRFQHDPLSLVAGRFESTGSSASRRPT
jgi:hypothetical protein